MNKRLFVLLAVVSILLIASAATTFGKQDGNSLNDLVAFVEAGGGSVHFVPEVVAEPVKKWGQVYG